ncbi:hypothetical protein, partial [Gulosibacter sp. 10]|uniref:hypothetical protein n=1 Tax=Gulosibacter sp. 10 TaxID=1255570 RepID=UPI001C3C7800
GSPLPQPQHRHQPPDRVQLEGSKAKQITTREDDFRMDILETQEGDENPITVPLEFAVYTLEHDPGDDRSQYAGATAIHVFGDPGHPLVLNVSCPAEMDKEIVLDRLASELESLEIIITPSKP